MTVTELGVCALDAAIPVGLTTSGAAGPAVDGPGIGVVACEGFGTLVRTVRRDLVVSAGWVTFGFGGVGALTVTGGSRSGEADCWALAGEIPANAIGKTTVEASKQVRCRFAALEREDMG